MPDPEGYAGSWLRLSEGLIGGIHHALNNRMAALGGAVQVLEGDLAAAHPLVGAMSGELQRLEATAGLLRLLTGGEGEFEAVQIEETMAQSRLLFEVHHALRDLRLNLISQAGLLPLWTLPAELLRAVLLMMAGGGNGSAGPGSEVVVAVSGDEVWLRIAVEIDRAEGEGIGETSVEILPGDIESIAARLGGEFEVRREDGTTRWELSLPTLPEVRRREKG